MILAFLLAEQMLLNRHEKGTLYERTVWILQRIMFSSSYLVVSWFMIAQKTRFILPVSKKFLFLFFVLYLAAQVFNPVIAQDTINWRKDYKLKWEDFKGKPDSTTIDLAVCVSEITYQYKVVNGKLTFSIDCFFDKKRSWIKHNMQAILDHEQGHFDISKLFSLKLRERFEAYKLNTATVEQDLIKLYNQTIQERTKMHKEYDKIESQNPMTDVPQKKFVEKIRWQITFLKKQMGCE